MPEGLANLIYRQSEGNPLFMVTALDRTTQRASLSRESGAWKLRVPLDEIASVPEKLRRMIETQIDRLSTEQRHALDVASVAGVAFPARACAAAADVDPEGFEGLCEELSRRHHIVRSAGSEHLSDGTISARYEFVHGLYREVFYRRLASGRAAKLHQRIGERWKSSFQTV